MGLYRKAKPDELHGATVLLDTKQVLGARANKSAAFANKSAPAANNSANKSRPGAKARAQMEATPEGRALLAAAKAEVAAIVAPILAAGKRGRPIKQTGDPARDKRNAEQRELMRKRRAAK